MITISVANQKGGCGKTTTAVNLSAALAMTGKRVVLIDLDPQGHATLGVGCDPDQCERTIYDVMSNGLTPFSFASSRTSVNGLDIVPSNVLLSGLETEISTMYGREYLLHSRLGQIDNLYDVCVIDCSPSLSLLTLNALVASDGLIVPVQTQYYSLEGLKQLLETVSIVRERFNPVLDILGILLTCYESRTLLSKQVESQMRDHFGNLVFKTIIHRTVRIAESPGAGLPVVYYDPACKGSLEYKSLADEIDHEIKIRTTQASFLNI
ncbi:Sporulation initiation inhibitor protein soj [Anaerohalosphaera lusitana]|uniref:Sporulation initiation inhibitor protein soj n=1 Tax=Anaerohalosphaera lusitana TaxID=1936003 RepID=A0A1U9NPQ4_9BACT|nr:ParA family protein [Anaerohalosphaera lusitana]AQT69590.1 Sporulation initiation inhibitor protein soj [Anaerohalosphaera lusitana]